MLAEVDGEPIDSPQELAFRLAARGIGGVGRGQRVELLLALGREAAPADAGDRGAGA